MAETSDTGLAHGDSSPGVDVDFDPTVEMVMDDYDVDVDFDPTVEMMMDDYDDERTMEEEEALSPSESMAGDELDDLQKEGDMPIEALLAMYGYSAPGGPSSPGHGNGEQAAVPAGDGDMNGAGEDEGSQDNNTDHMMSSQTVRLLRSDLMEENSSDDDDEEDDDDYDPDKYDNWRKTIQVGSDFQAAVPEGMSCYPEGGPEVEKEDRLLWSFEPLTDETVDSYLVEVHRHNMKTGQGVQALPTGAHKRDDEQALYLLQTCEHNVEEALRRHKMQSVIASVDPMTLWSEEECRNFESGLRAYGKDFFLNQQNKTLGLKDLISRVIARGVKKRNTVRTRSVGELVQFYYFWKKTERHDAFAARTRLEKKKYTLHPGITDYMDRFLDEQENPYESRASTGGGGATGGGASTTGGGANTAGGGAGPTLQTVLYGNIVTDKRLISPELLELSDKGTTPCTAPSSAPTVIPLLSIPFPAGMRSGLSKGEDCKQGSLECDTLKLGVKSNNEIEGGCENKCGGDMGGEELRAGGDKTGEECLMEVDSTDKNIGGNTEREVKDCGGGVEEMKSADQVCREESIVAEGVKMVTEADSHQSETCNTAALEPEPKEQQKGSESLNSGSVASGEGLMIEGKNVVKDSAVSSVNESTISLSKEENGGMKNVVSSDTVIKETGNIDGENAVETKTENSVVNDVMADETSKQSEVVDSSLGKTDSCEKYIDNSNDLIVSTNTNMQQSSVDTLSSSLPVINHSMISTSFGSAAVLPEDCGSMVANSVTHAEEDNVEPDALLHSRVITNGLASDGAVVCAAAVEETDVIRKLKSQVCQANVEAICTQNVDLNDGCSVEGKVVSGVVNIGNESVVIENNVGQSVSADSRVNDASTVGESIVDKVITDVPNESVALVNAACTDNVDNVPLRNGSEITAEEGSVEIQSSVLPSPDNLPSEVKCNISAPDVSSEVMNEEKVVEEKSMVESRMETGVALDSLEIGENHSSVNKSENSEGVINSSACPNTSDCSVSSNVVNMDNSHKASLNIENNVVVVASLAGESVVADQSVTFVADAPSCPVDKNVLNSEALQSLPDIKSLCESGLKVTTNTEASEAMDVDMVAEAPKS